MRLRRINSISRHQHHLAPRTLGFRPAARRCNQSMEKAKKTESNINVLPEEMIQHIQSFLTGKEAVQTTTLSRSWHKAWLTRPDLNLDYVNFHEIIPFQEYALKTMKRYQDLNVNINSFTLNYDKGGELLFTELVVKAIKLGATNLNLSSHFLLVPKEVLESKTLIQLSLKRCTLTCGNVNSYRSLKSLRLYKVFANCDVINGIVSSCCHSLEELEISSYQQPFDGVYGLFGFRKPKTCASSNRLEKLKFLSLGDISFNQSFFNDDFSSRFPSLKDLSLSNCHIRPYPIRISSPSVERINLSGATTSAYVQLDLPRIRKFEYSVDFLKYSHLENGLRIGLTPQTSVICESHIWISLGKNYNVERTEVFLRTLKDFLMELRWSKISLYLDTKRRSMSISLNDDDDDVELPQVDEDDHDIELPQVVLENLTVNVPSSARPTLLKGLNRVCTPLHMSES